MNKKHLLALAALGVGAVVFSATGRVTAAPSPAPQSSQDCSGTLESQKIADAIRARIDAIRSDALNGAQAQVAGALAEKQAALTAALTGREGVLRAQLMAEDALARAQEWNQESHSSPMIWSDENPQGEDAGWLGVETEGVNADRAKELKLPATRGVYISEVEEGSPAAKAGLKSGDVVTEFNGEHVEGTVQFRRLIREIPAGHTVQITIWRDGHSQTVNATLSSMEDSMDWGFDEAMPRVAPMAPATPRPPRPPLAFSVEMPNIEIFSAMSTPTIGISAEDLSGQLGAYFGAPDGEGILVTDVQSGSPAEKSGIKAGDVVVKIAGDRVRNLGEMRDKLRDKRDEKTVAITVLRRGSEQNLTVEPAKPQNRMRATRRATL